MLLSIVATAFLGIVFSRRLVPTIGGTLAAALFLGILINGFQLMRLSSYWVSGIEGALILLVVAATARLGQKGAAPMSGATLSHGGTARPAARRAAPVSGSSPRCSA